jgi:hypothetical protein
LNEKTNKEIHEDGCVWDVSPYSLLDVDIRFRGTYCVHHQGDEFLEISMSNNQTTQPNIPENFRLYTRQRENLTPHEINVYPV